MYLVIHLCVTHTKVRVLCPAPERLTVVKVVSGDVLFSENISIYSGGASPTSHSFIYFVLCVVEACSPCILTVAERKSDAVRFLTIYVHREARRR